MMDKINRISALAAAAGLSAYATAAFNGLASATRTATGRLQRYQAALVSTEDHDRITAAEAKRLRKQTRNRRNGL